MQLNVPCLSSLSPPAQLRRWHEPPPDLRPAWPAHNAPPACWSPLHRTPHTRHPPAVEKGAHREMCEKVSISYKWTWRVWLLVTARRVGYFMTRSKRGTWFNPQRTQTHYKSAHSRTKSAWVTQQTLVVRDQRVRPRFWPAIAGQPPT